MPKPLSRADKIVGQRIVMVDELGYGHVQLHLDNHTVVNFTGTMAGFCWGVDRDERAVLGNGDYEECEIRVDPYEPGDPDEGRREPLRLTAYAVGGPEGIFAAALKERTVTLYSGDDGWWRTMYRFNVWWLPRVIACLQALLWRKA